jgi:hypothetical protein
MRVVAFVVMGLAVTSTAVLAQTGGTADWPPAAGARVRIESAALGVERQVGTVESVAGDTLHFRRAEDGSRASLMPSDITKIEVSAGTHTSKAKGAAIGLLVGAALGAAIGGATYTPCEGLACIGDIGGRQGSIVASGILGALTGGIAGALFGSRHRETWKPVSH